jgi:hypothetical protein
MGPRRRRLPPRLPGPRSRPPGRPLPPQTRNPRTTRARSRRPPRIRRSKVGRGRGCRGRSKPDPRAGRLRRSGFIQVRSPGSIRVWKEGTSRARGRRWTRSRLLRRLRRLFASRNPRRCRGHPPPAVPWATGPPRPPRATRSQIVHHSRPPATGSALHRRSAARAVPPSLPRPGPQPLQIPPPQRTGPPATSPPTPAARPRRTARRPRPAAPPAGQMEPKLTGWSDQQPRPWILPAGRMVSRLAVGNRPRPAGCDRMGRRRVVGNRPRGLRGGWRGLRHSTSTVRGVRTSRRVGPDGRPWMPVGGQTLRWAPLSTGRRPRRRFGPARWTRRHPGRVSGPHPTRAVARSAGPPTRRPRDPARGR